MQFSLIPQPAGIPAIHEGSALYRVLTQRVGRFPGKSIISLWTSATFPSNMLAGHINIWMLDLSVFQTFLNQEANIWI